MTIDNDARPQDHAEHSPSSGTTAAAMTKIDAELEQRAPPPAPQSAHALWMGGLVAVLYLAGSRGIGADTPVVSLISVAVAGGLIFAISWFEGRAAKRAHAMGRKEMAREMKKVLGG